MSFIQGSDELSNAIYYDTVDYLKARLSIDELQKTRFTAILGNEVTLLQYTCVCHAYKCMEYLIEMGVDVNEVIVRDNGPSTALLSALSWNEVTCVEILLKAGADPNLLTPLTRAGLAGRLGDTSARILIQYGADGSFLAEDHPLKGMWKELCVLRKQVEVVCLCPPAHAPYGRVLHKNILRNIGKHLWSMREK